MKAESEVAEIPKSIKKVRARYGSRHQRVGYVSAATYSIIYQSLRNHLTEKCFIKGIIVSTEGDKI